MCENGCRTFTLKELKLVEGLEARLQIIEGSLAFLQKEAVLELEDRLKRIEEQLKNHEMILVEKVI